MPESPLHHIDLSVNVNVSYESIINSIIDSCVDPISFIIELDNAIADEGFTLGLIKRLTASMIKHYSSSEEYSTGRILKETFGDEGPLATYYPHPSEDLKTATRCREAMEQIVSLVEEAEGL